MSKNGVYFDKNKKNEASEQVTENGPKKRKGIITALIYAAITIAAVAIYMIVRSDGVQNFVVLFLALAVVVTCIEAAWSEPDRKSYVLWKRLFNKE